MQSATISSIADLGRARLWLRRGHAGTVAAAIIPQPVPIYEYKCDNGHVFDVIQRMSDEPLTECQECGAPAVRVLHSPAVHFKGSGFYNTDYGKKKAAATAPARARRSRRAPTSSDSSSSSGLEVQRVEVERLQAQGSDRRPTR